jgi:hypothetical protein
VQNVRRDPEAPNLLDPDWRFSHMAQNDPNGNRQDRDSWQDEPIGQDDSTRQSRGESDRQGDQQSQDSSNRQGVKSDRIDSDIEDLDDMDEDRDEDLRTSGNDRRGR